MNVQEIVARQYHSELNMLEQTIESCPQTLWLAALHHSPNRFWHVAYHALFYTHFYLAPQESEFVAWRLHRKESNFLGEVPWRPNEPHIVDEPYSQPELLEYAALCHGEIDSRTAALDLEAPSGFFWLPMGKLELQLYNLRHLAHHTGQLIDRLRSQANLGIPWVR